MNTKILTALTIFMIATPAFALDPYSRNDRPVYRERMIDRGERVYNDRLDSDERIGVTCSLYVDDELEHKGYCRVGRGRGERSDVSLFNTGTTVYKLIREDRYTGRFYRGVNSDYSYGVVNARGNCWVGRRINFCAD